MIQPLPRSVNDPVCGMRLEKGGQYLHLDFKGHRLFFCCEPCLEKFMADPNYFLKPKGWWRRYVERLISSNAKQFGGKKPSCHK
ncbi:hypothetical protein AAU61_18840 [Desulfocarbo indianensis]|nr:hypothetical protein AAU61_18840 [Desulfocarbo indianensis]